MPEGFEEVSFNTSTQEIELRQANERSGVLVIWPRGEPQLHRHQTHRNTFRSYYERCNDSTLCDEVIYTFEKVDSDYRLSLFRMGSPLLTTNTSGNAALTYPVLEHNRCDQYKALARELWEQPTRQELGGRLEVFELNKQIWGAVLCTEDNGGELFVGRTARVRLIYDPT